MSQNAAHFAYRADIDGLRAAAVSAVLLYHYRAPGFGGGFIGVDVFFVISGFLITGLVAADIDRGRFTLQNFYARRVRRIFPALFAMLALATIAACWLLFPQDLIRYGRSLAATALFAANIEFWADSGYFQPAALQRPLLHLWSIGVEEQFYLLFPVLLVWAGRRRLMLAAGLMLASFGFSLWAVATAPGFAFYMLPSRMWELMLGAVLALLPLNLAPRWREAAAWAGLAGIGYATVRYNASTPFPGAAALLPCLAAGLVIAAGAGPASTWGSRFLSWRPFVNLGLISYPLYLWHWPVYVFAQYGIGRPLSGAETALCFLIALMLSIVSYRYVEQRLRRGAVLGSRPIGYGLLAMAVCFTASAILVAGEGLPQRYPAAVQRILFDGVAEDPTPGSCFNRTLVRVNAPNPCLFGAGPQTKPTMLLWGDSHARALGPPIARLAAARGLEGAFVGYPSCAPLLSVSRIDVPRCAAFSDRVLAMVQAHREIRLVILAARWAKNASGLAYGEEGNGFVPLRDSAGTAKNPSENAEMFARGLRRTIAALRALDVRVAIIASVPEIGYPVPNVLAKQMLTREPLWHGPSLAQFRARQGSLNTLFLELAQEPGVTVIFPADYLCRSGSCAVIEDGRPLYRDAHHVNAFGARKLEPLLAGVFAAPPRP